MTTRRRRPGEPAWDVRIEALPDDLLTCRAIGHHWQHGNDEVIERDSRREVLLFRRRWDCTSCPTRRFDTVNARSWTVVGRRYQYPSAYQLQGDRPDSAAVRRAMYARSSELFADQRRRVPSGH